MFDCQLRRKTAQNVQFVDSQTVIESQLLHWSRRQLRFCLNTISIMVPMPTISLPLRRLSLHIPQRVSAQDLL